MNNRALLTNLVLCLGVAAVPEWVEAANYYVGGDLSCTHSSVQAAINAAEANPGADTIYIARSASWTQQALTVSTSQELDLEGGYETCGNFAGDGTFTVLDGAGGSAAPVLQITGNTGSIIRLRYLRLSNGDPSGSNNGGGINYSGNGSLQIGNSAISNNRAFKGGGIYANGTGSAAELLLFANVTVAGNVARGDGGGVFVNGMTFSMQSPNSIIANNVAEGQPGTTGYGGGLAVRSSSGRMAIAYIGSGGVGTLGAIYGNQARYGGGVAVSGGDGADADAELQLFTVEADKPAAIRGNFASVGGGGIYLWPDQSAFTSSNADAYLWNAEITGNAAPEGAAAYLDNSTNGLDSNASVLSANAVRPAGALACPSNAFCGRISGNIAEDAGGNLTQGAIVYLTDTCIFALGNSASRGSYKSSGIALDLNSGGRLFNATGAEFDGYGVVLIGALIADNETSLELMRAGGNSEIEIEDSTISNNSIGATNVLAVGGGNLQFRRSVLWQPGKTSTTPPVSAGNPSVEWSIASEAASLGGGPGVVVAAPRFIDPPRGDYRLRAASPAIDYAPPIVGDDRDAFNLPRDQRLDAVPRPVPERARDAGAFERQSLQPLVLNADFAGDLNIWKYLAGDPTVYDPTDNAPNSLAGTGSARISGTSSAPRLDGSFQCIHLPGPGRYRLNGWAHSSGTPLTRNATVLFWEYRANGGEGCINGAVTLVGQHFLNGLGIWAQPTEAATIDVPESEWNSNSSISILMSVLANSTNNQFNGWFDDISLILESNGNDRIFADGFDNPP